MTFMQFKRPEEFHTYIFSWWETHKRDLPWRHTRDPYHILVSEVMLQQTQVSRVLPKYDEFFRAFPDVFALSHASPAKLLTIWKGLGYNRRALYLKRAAEAVVREYNGIFPIEESQLVKLPGLGRYTARALMVFAFEKDVAMVDTNIRQIITHFFYNDVSQKEKIIEDMADTLVPLGKSWQWHQALMDYGSLELTKMKRPDKPRKASVPFKDSNRYFRGKIVDRLREGQVLESLLIEEFSKQYKKQPSFIREIIQKLIKDELVGQTGNLIHLPE